jgi:fatty-acyl-CoA synthase
MNQSSQRESAAQAWLRALQCSSSVPRNRARTLAVAVDEVAEKTPDVSAIISAEYSFTYAQLAIRQNQYARLALDLGVEKNDVVCLLMENCPEYSALWVGMSSVGATVALLNTNLTEKSLWHCIEAAQPKHVVVSSTIEDVLLEAVRGREIGFAIWVLGGEQGKLSSLDQRLNSQSGARLSEVERRGTSISDRALCIYTSGTTGLPKAANVSHARIMQWSQWFAGMLGVEPDDRMYNCLPMYHSVGGVLALGAVLTAGATVVVRERFSASQFWSDIHRWQCTIFQYIGELCRYLVLTTVPEQAVGHRLRVACGNGMSQAVWADFVERFRIPRVLEFYASTEGGVSLFNAEGKPGSIGRVPPYLVHRYSPVIVKLDVETQEPLRDDEGLCILCGLNETGEALGRVEISPSSIGTRYEGYTDERASENKLLRNVLSQGDVWVRTGDLLRRDEKGFYYFVDRIGDTFRWKGENVSTTEVADIISRFPGIEHVSVYGVAVAGSEGRAGMATLVAEDSFDLTSFRGYLASHLPSYAQPLFVRFHRHAQLTGTHKYSKAELIREGYDTSLIHDPIYFHDIRSESMTHLDAPLYERIKAGQIHL